MSTDKQKKTEVIAINTLKKIFTSGQIAVLMSSRNSRVK